MNKILRKYIRATCKKVESQNFELDLTKFLELTKSKFRISLSRNFELVSQKFELASLCKFCTFCTWPYLIRLRLFYAGTKFLNNGTVVEKMWNILGILWQNSAETMGCVSLECNQITCRCCSSPRVWFSFSAWWRHQMETFSALLAFCAGNSPGTGEFPSQRPTTRGFAVFFDLRLNKRLSKQSWGWWFETLSRPLWRHRDGNHDIQKVP